MRRYLLTKFLYPLENPIYLSNKLDLSIDNLRSEKEIEALKNLIKTSMGDGETTIPSYYNRWLPKTAGEGEVSVDNVLKKFFTRNESKKYISRFHKKYQSNDSWDIISRMWTILRVGDNSEIYSSLDEKEASKLFYPEDEDPIQENAVNYSYLLSLLISKGNDDYFGETFVIPQLNYLLEYPEPNAHLNYVIQLFCITNFMDHAPKKTEQFHDFISAIELLQAKSNQIEQILNKETVKKLLYIGNLLKAADNRHIDSRLRFNTLVSIIELILTHNPDYNRFNVEDSISKQFRLKTSVLAYIENPEINLDEIKHNLKEIYSQRSNIAHGNFSEFYKYLAKGKTKDSYYPTHHFDELTDNLYGYARTCVNQYTLRREFVEFLKHA